MVCIYVFSDDTYAQDSIEMLQACGLRFRKHATHGIESVEFAELLMTSGSIKYFYCTTLNECVNKDVESYKCRLVLVKQTPYKYLHILLDII